MKKLIMMMLAALCALLPAAAGDRHAHTAAGQDQAVEKPADCQSCGMNRTAFASSRMLITFADGGTFGTCSINCAHDAAAKNGARKIKRLQAADYVGNKLIDAKKAFWVIGGNEPGVMSNIAKWAFAKKQDAERFVKEHGGRVTGFDEAWKAAAQ